MQSSFQWHDSLASLKITFDSILFLFHEICNKILELVGFAFLFADASSKFLVDLFLSVKVELQLRYFLTQLFLIFLQLLQ